MQILSNTGLQNLHFYMSKTKCLDLATTPYKYELPKIAELLRSSCELEALIIRFPSTLYYGFGSSVSIT